MQLSITFSQILAREIGKSKIIEIPKQELTIDEFRIILELQDWAEIVLEEGYIKEGIVLFIDKEMIQFSSKPKTIITPESEISFHVMFAGG